MKNAQVGRVEFAKRPLLVIIEYADLWLSTISNPNLLTLTQSCPRLRVFYCCLTTAAGISKPFRIKKCGSNSKTIVIVWRCKYCLKRKF